MAESVKTGQLMTSGIYAWIWHPVYSSFLLLNCGLLLIQTNW
nr:isoprenylcysteine carboxylmethyltransferase family protein [Pauljensenia sp. OF14-1SRA]